MITSGCVGVDGSTEELLYDERRGTIEIKKDERGSTRGTSAGGGGYCDDWPSSVGLLSTEISWRERNCQAVSCNFQIVDEMLEGYYRVRGTENADIFSGSGRDRCYLTTLPCSSIVKLVRKKILGSGALFLGPDVQRTTS